MIHKTNIKCSQNKSYTTLTNSLLIKNSELTRKTGQVYLLCFCVQMASQAAAVTRLIATLTRGTDRERIVSLYADVVTVAVSGLLAVNTHTVN